MRFKLIDRTPDNVVNITTKIDPVGDVEVMANGIIILWITTGGEIVSRYIHYGEKDVLVRAGFVFDDNRIKVR